MKTTTFTNLIASIALTATATQALAVNTEDDHPKHALALSANGYGVGFTYRYSINEDWHLRAAIHGFEEDDHDIELDNIDYRGDGESYFGGAFVDWSPFKNSWKRKVYFTGGLVSVDQSFEGTAAPKLGDDITVGNSTFNANELIDLAVDVEFDQQVSPYLGVGIRSKAEGPGLFFAAELGLFHLDDPTVSLTGQSEGGTLTTADLDNERSRIEDEFDNLNATLTFSVGYQF